MSEVLFGPKSGIYRLDGDRVFHSESRVWEKTLLMDEDHRNVTRLADRQEWVDWWNATIDISIDPRTFAPKAVMDLRPLLKPMFERMNKAQLAKWLEERGFKLPEKKVTRAMLVSRAEYVWFGGPR